MKINKIGAMAIGFFCLVSAHSSSAQGDGPAAPPGSTAEAPHTPHDVYPDFAALAAAQQEGVDYRIVVEDRGSPLTVLAIHGGIDLNTETIARAIAEKDLNLYIFEGIKPQGNHALHLTSTHFDEPQALALAARSSRCLSIHGYVDKTRKQICFGGDDVQYRDSLQKELDALQLPFETASLCAGLEGTDPENIVNRCQHGVQLEFSSSLRDELTADPDLMERLASAIHRSFAALPTAPPN